MKNKILAYAKITGFVVGVACALALGIIAGDLIAFGVKYVFHYIFG